MIMIANLQYSWTLFVKPIIAATGLEVIGSSVGIHVFHCRGNLGDAAFPAG